MEFKTPILVAIMLLALVAIPAFPQSLTTGDVTGLVTDPTGAVLPNVQVTLKNNGTGQTLQQNTSSTGTYRFSLLNPGSYTISANGTGFQATSTTAVVAVGQ